MSIEPPATGSVPAIPLPPDPLPAGAAGQPPPADGQWSVLGAMAFVALIVGGTMLAGLAAQQGYLVWRLGAEALLDADAMNRLAKDETRDLFIAIQLAAQLVELALIFWLAGVWHRDRNAALNLVPSGYGAMGLLGAVLLVFAVKIAASVATAGIGTADPAQELKPFIELVRTPLAWALFFITVVLAGATEELLFRGVLSRTLEATWLGFWGGAGLASASFAMLHMQYGIGGQLVVFAIGMALAWIRRRAGSLWPAIFCHAVNNAVALVAMRMVG